MKPPYRVIILDDEPPARELMQVFVGRMPDLHCISACSNVMQGLLAIQEHKPDLLLLDIQMPEMTGLELMELPLINQPEIILTTAYPEYALVSYDFSVLDYLVKPIAFDRFTKAITRFRQKRELYSISTSAQVDNGVNEGFTSLLNSQSWTADERSVWLREEKRLRQIPYEAIFFIEGLKDYVKVHLANEVIITHLGIGQAEKIFSPPHFIRIHRSYIVRKSAIHTIDGNTIILSNKTEVILGPLYRDELYKYITDLPKI